MGVKSLWEIVGPAARPVKLEALSRKKLAVDASIWIYQFLKAVRDKEGNALNLSHIVGFFRRICKLLYFGILPLFVFDGGAPALKRQVIQSRREKREGNRDNITTAAQKLLAMKLQRKLETPRQVQPGTKKDAKSAQLQSNGSGEFVYLADMPLQHDREQGIEIVPDTSPQRPFRKKDEYDLPKLKNFTYRKGDERIMPKEEYESYDDGGNWDVVDGIQIDSVDPSSQEFADLPMATQYMILSHLRLRSRLRLGYTKDQLEELFPNSQDFSKFQIQQVQKRNYYTQRLMNVSGMGEDTDKARRIAGDKDKLYVLVKNDDGWTLSLGGEDGEKPIEVDNEDILSSPHKQISIQKAVSSVGSNSDDDLLEDVSLGGDEEQELAVVQSIYDQYKDDFEYPAKVIPKKNLAEFDPIELKTAIEESKKDYVEIKKKEEEALGKVLDAADQNGFDLGQSFLFKSDEKDNAISELKSPLELDSKEPTEQETVRDNDQTKSPSKVNTIPSWFGEQSQIANPHQGLGFIDDKEEQTRPPNEEEEMGIIDWSEAKEMLRRTQESEQEVAQVDSSDLEIMDEIQISQPKTKEVGRQPENDQKEHLKVQKISSMMDDERVDMNDVVEIIEESGYDEATLETSKEHATNESNYLKTKQPTGSGNMLTSKIPKGKKLISSTFRNVETSRTIPSDEESDEKLLDQKQLGELPPLPEEYNSEEKQTQGEKHDNDTTRKSETKTILDYDFDEEEEKLLMKQLDEEEQEHVHFASSLKSVDIPIGTAVTNEQLLQEQMQKAKRDADEVTDTMINDVQELLKRFGIPFITAPMEAEAQCAQLYSMGMVDGIITDDSDCFLFGGSRIYKNMFNQKQYVECYIAEDIEHKCGLDRDKLIELALLLGSDYTEGIKGIGPVLAMEILAEFGNLKQFKKWFDQHAKTTVRPEKDVSKLQKNLLARIRSGKLFLPDSFPDPVVCNAYKHADIDNDDSMFKWGIPRLDHIRSFLMYNVGWSQERVDEVMVPLIQSMNRQRQEGKQTTIGEFFPQEYISYKKDVGLGKRMKVAAKKLKGD